MDMTAYPHIPKIYIAYEKCVHDDRSVYCLFNVIVEVVLGRYQWVRYKLLVVIRNMFLISLEFGMRLEMCYRIRIRNFFIRPNIHTNM